MIGSLNYLKPKLIMKIIVFVFLISMFCLPYKAYSDPSCTEALKQKPNKQELELQLIYLLLLHDKVRIENLSKERYSNLWKKINNLIKLAIDIDLHAEVVFPTLFWAMDLAPLFSPARQLIHTILAHPKVNINHVLDFRGSTETLLTFSIRFLNAAKSEKEGQILVDIIRRIIEHPGFEMINVRSRDGNTALSYLLEEFNYDYRKKHDVSSYTFSLFERIPDKKEKDLLRGDLFWKIEESYIDRVIIESIIKHPQFDPNLTFGKNRRTYLHMARDKKREYVLELLLYHPDYQKQQYDNKQELNDRLENLLLHDATSISRLSPREYDHLWDEIDSLIQAGADVSLKNNSISVLLWAMDLIHIFEPAKSLAYKLFHHPEVKYKFNPKITAWWFAHKNTIDTSN